MTTLATLKDRYTEVRHKIDHAAARAGKSAKDIVLVAVTKFAEPEQIRELIALGHADFGENKVQQLVQRAAIIDEWLTRQRAHAGLRSAPAAAGAGGAGTLPQAVRWHMIGHLQRNKARKALELARLIHSVDSLRLAEEIQAVATKLRVSPMKGQAAQGEHVVDVLLQVNCSGEQSKFGCSIPAAPHLAEQIDTMVQVRLRGLMTMAPISQSPEDARATFARCRELFEDMQERGLGGGGNPAHFNILSMGMSGDYEVAIEEGSNLVRVGSAIFGEPKPGAVEEDADEADD